MDNYGINNQVRPRIIVFVCRKCGEVKEDSGLVCEKCGCGDYVFRLAYLEDERVHFWHDERLTGGI